MNAPPVPAAQRLPLPAMAPPASLEATGVSKALLLELVLKHLQRGGDASMAELGASVALPLPVLDRLLGFLREEQYIEVPRRGSFDAEVRYALTGPGARAPKRRCAGTSMPAPRRFRCRTTWRRSNASG